MMTRTRPSLLSHAMLRSTALATLLGAAMLVSPMSRAGADDAAMAPSAMPATAPKSAALKPDSVENRIASLHKSLKITADEETAWNAVAQTMRDNEAAMQKLVEARKDEQDQKVSAVEDLKIYASFTQAHVDGLQKLIASFDTLYEAMPDPQKAIADHVFQQYGHKGNPAHK
jgi:hypothetical protein